MRLFFIIFSLLLAVSGTLASATTILCLGDSLTEGYGVKREEAWPEILDNNLRKENPKIKVINAGISGSTSAGGPSRLKWHIKSISKSPIDLLILALGANDGLRGLSTVALKKNLEDTIDLATAAKIKVLLVGMKAPPSLGKEYVLAFDSVYPSLAKSKDIPLVPFMLEGVAADPTLNISDGIHPNAVGHKILAGTIGKYVVKAIN